MNRLHVWLILASLAAAAPAIAGGVSTEDVTGAIARDAAPADALPAQDFARSCAQAFASREAIGMCITREDAARTQLDKQWATLSPRVKRLCVSRVPGGVARFYGSLADCVMKEGRLEKFRSVEISR